MGVGLINHYNIRTDKLAETVAFYEGIVGLEVGDRPNFSFPGAWLYSEGRAVVHLVDIAGTDEKMETGRGPIDHIAFDAVQFKNFKEKLDNLDVKHEWRDVPGGLIRQIFLTDPNGVTLELNFDLTQEP